MRLVALGLLALAFALPSQAQEIRPSLRSTVVVPSNRGEAVRITTYSRRPPQQGRLSRRYRGLRANRSPRTQARVINVTGTRSRTVQTTRHRFIQRGGTYFQVLPQR